MYRTLYRDTSIWPDRTKILTTELTRYL